MPRQTEQPWERQPGESEQAFEAFKIYRDLGVRRSNAEACKQLSKSRQLISRWKSKYEWDDRVRAYDNDLEKQQHAEAVKNLKDMTGRHIKIAMSLQRKALEALDKLKVEDMTPKDIKEYIKMATELERLNRLTSAAKDESLEEEEQQTVVDIYLPAKEGDDD